jgi:tRNA-specific 2-thiouridylase
VPNGSYAATVAKLRPGAIEPGDIVGLDGRVLGRHDGIIHFTVGQRKGIGIAAAEPLYVVRLEPRTRRVVVGARAALERRRVPLGDVHWLGAEPSFPEQIVDVKLRSAQPPVRARLYLSERAGEAVLDEPAVGVSPGQACVFYQGTRVLGGGWISRDDPVADAGLTGSEPVTNIPLPSVAG